MSDRLTLSADHFTRVFPFHCAVDRELRVVQAGDALLRACPDVELGKAFFECFELVRPGLANPDYDAIAQRSKSLFMLRHSSGSLQLRGQMLPDEERGLLFFLGSPWVTAIDQVKAAGISLRDFALHDPISDFLFLLQTREASLTDAHRLSDQLRAQARDLETARDAAESANRAKSQFIANMSHEIRTPLNGILGISEMLLDSGLEKDHASMMDTVHVSSRALLEIINDILDFSKIESGQLYIRLEPFKLRPLAQATLEVLRPHAAGKGIALHLDTDDDVPEWVNSDSGRVRQILLNLTGNAVKFTDHGEVRLHISTHPKGICFEVRDTGVGIPQEAIGSIFEAFQQADATATRRFGGTGLGLAITRRLCDALGGTVQVESTEGEGSRFWFVLPVGTVVTPLEETPSDTGDTVVAARVDLDVEAQKESPAEAPSASPTAPQFQARVLVAEDNVINQKVALRMLSKLGCDVSVVENGQLAVEAVQSDEYDLVLMDFNMPVMDGAEATKAIRSAEASEGGEGHIPIVALTANALQEDRERCLNSGMDGYLSKPVSLTVLRDCLAQWLRPSASTPTAS